MTEGAKRKRAKNVGLATRQEIERVLETARRTGLPISGFTIEPGKIIKVQFAGAVESEADAALDRWQRGRRGAD
ncbi:hypothetical protein [Alkalilacustris brevis]|uniref:hypothetical protein n=1 Tax=Alkalilacustris brevis TaxID=2026338 RepID=UPI0013906A80|nr:hypothetical protein [Alkalilacustris brevis]